MSNKAKQKEFTAEELEAARKARNAYLRAWRKRNPEKVQAAVARHWLKVAEAQKGAAADES